METTMAESLIDLRSDTVIKPPPAMREVIGRGEFADNVRNGTGPSFPA
jgi:hypothetical protein